MDDLLGIDRRDKLALGRVYGVPAGDPEAGKESRVLVTSKEAQAMKGDEAPSDGVYLRGGGRFKVKAGQRVPEGAEFVPGKPAPEKAERPKPANKKDPKPPANKSE